MKRIRFMYLLIITIFFFILLTSIYYYKTQEIAMSNAQNKVDELLLNYQALRTNVSQNQKKEIYSLQKLGIIDSEYFHPSLLSSTYNAKQVNINYNKLRKKENKKPIIIRFSSNNPRNLQNQATKKEIEILKKFNNNTINSYTEIIKKNNETFLYSAIPTKRTTKKCMKCHSKPNIAPNNLIDMYGDKNGFYENEGKIRALLTTMYPLDEDLNHANTIFIVLTTITFIFFSILLVIIFIFMRRLQVKIGLEINKNKEIQILNKEIKKHENELKILNTNLEIKIDKKTQELQKSLHIMSKYIIYSRTNLKGIIIEASDAFCDISQYSKNELLGKPHNIIRHPDMPKEIFKEMWKVIRSGKVWQGEVKNRKKDGNYYWVQVDISPEFDNNGNIHSYVAIRHDITAKKDFEIQHKQLVQSERLASMGEMIGNIAHQWRQPLSVISTGVTGMKMQKKFNTLNDEQFLETCDIVNNNAQYLSKTIDDFQSFIKGDSIKKVFKLENELNSFLHLVEGSIKNHNINIILDIQKDIQIDGYNNEFIQSIINIFNNAKDALTKNDVENKYIFISVYTKYNNIIIALKDNAGGIPDEVLPKIFEPYFTTKHQSQGTGLGLHMTYKLVVDGMDGTIEANNVTYKYNGKKYTGAEFLISLPIS